MFLESVPARLALVKTSLDSRDYEKIKAEAHSLKSSGGNLGARRFAALCEELELLEGGSVHKRASELLAQLEVEFKAVRDALEGRLKRAA
jgi:HPt (histidine-containing phosphotransfer) domain-containing protein